MSRKHKKKQTLHNALSEQYQAQVEISLIDYNETYYEERVIEDIREAYDYHEKQSITWINVDGTQDEKAVKAIGLYYHLHPLLQEDIMDISHRPKVDFYEGNTFTVLQMLSYDTQRQEVESEQVSLVLGANFVISFQEEIEGDVFGLVRQRLRGKVSGKLRNSGAAYLFYALIDTIVDNYFLVLEQVAEKLERLEEDIIDKASDHDPTRQLYELKRQLNMVRKAVRPMREIVTQLIREETLFLKEDNFYLRDLYDHVIQVTDNCEAYIEVTKNLMDLHLNLISNKTNDVMKVLTIFSTIFMPLTFIVGVYGMNFEHMPELKTELGYWVVWGVMILVSASTYLFFKMKKWL